jgi:polyhydroxybutyrate depolymerase
MKRVYLPALTVTTLLAIVVSGSVAAATSSGCGKTGLASGSHTMRAPGGIDRSFRVQVPSSYDGKAALPLITVFHGWGGNEDDFLGDSTVTELASERGYILVAPRGLGAGAPDSSNNSWSFSGSTTGLDGDGVNSSVPGDGAAICDADKTPDYTYPSCRTLKRNTCSWTQCQADDVAFAVALVENVAANLCVDTERVFATGGSNGGMLAWELGQNPLSAPTFRAIAPVIGLPHRAYLSAQGKRTKMPVLVITGMQDTTVPPGAWDDPSYTTTSNDDDRYFYTGATAIVRRWGEANGCVGSDNAAPFDDGQAQSDCRTYCSGDAGWSGGAVGSGWPNVLDCRAAMGHDYGLPWSWKLILDFFDAHSRAAELAR